MEEAVAHPNWGIWLIGAVLAFNLACIPLWFLLNNLKRTHEFRIKQARTYLHVLEEERAAGRGTGGASLDQAVQSIEEQLKKAEGLGALWGRKWAAMAVMGTWSVNERFPEFGDRVQAKMVPGEEGA